MPPELRAGAVLDAGAFIALERSDHVMVHLAKRFKDAGTPLVTSAGVVAQVWRGGSGAQVAVAVLLHRTNVVDVTDAVARVLGRMLGATGTSDPIDAHVVLLAQRSGWPVLTSDPNALLKIEPNLTVELI